jgi:diaminopimelate decarboxylase
MPDTTSSDFNPEALMVLDYETPFFLFSKKRIANKLDEFKRSFPEAAIHYAIKANSEKTILEWLNEDGSCFEAASKHELDLLK